MNRLLVSLVGRDGEAVLLAGAACVQALSCRAKFP